MSRPNKPASDPDQSRKYPERPIVGVGGIVFRKDEVLLIKRGKEPGYGQWSIPGGAVRLGESLQEALVREILEETHLEVEVVALVKVLDRVSRDRQGRVAYHYVLVDFLCKNLSGSLRPDSDALDGCFVKVEALPSYQLAEVTLEVIRQADWMRQNAGRWDRPEGGGFY
jgi:8-oxo-dGTP diphosphatase